MTFLYNCKHDGDQFRISKFNSEDMNVESSYLCTETECNCPAGVRPTCRHRSMLPKFIKRGYIGTEFFFDYDRGGWVQLGLEWVVQDALGEAILSRNEILDDIPMIAVPPAPRAQQDAAKEDWDRHIAELPEGVTMIIMDSPEKVVDVHNAIAEAVGEPEATLIYATDETPLEITHVELFVEEPPTPTHIKRRL